MFQCRPESLTWFPAHLTKEKGFYRAEGLEVDFIIMKPQVAIAGFDRW
jgi:hypothetical protein